MMLDPFRFGLLMATMAYASYHDWISREVDDEIWIVSGFVGAALTIAELLSSWSFVKMILTVYSIAFGAGVACAFYYFELYGGADAKALIVISVTLPLHRPTRSFHPFTGLASLSNGLIISLMTLLSMLAKNVVSMIRGEDIFKGLEHENRLRKLAAMLLGIRVKDARSRRFWLPLEEEKEGKRRFKFNPSIARLEEIKRDDYWVTPGIPLLIFITIGFLIWFFFGDIAYLITSLIPGFS